MTWPPIPPIWRGQTAFVIAGGPSFGDVDPERLRGRNVIVINSSWLRVPFADVLFFGDGRWWRHWRSRVPNEFKGRIVTTDLTAAHPRVCRVRNGCPPRRPGRSKSAFGLSTDATMIPMRRTSLAPAINIAALLLGFEGRIVLMGADGGRSKDGRSHHHERHPWPVREGCWDVQRKDLAEIAPRLAELGVEVINASPGSKWDLWPIVEPGEVLGDHW